jgi:hypothetical protein
VACIRGAVALAQAPATAPPPPDVSTIVVPIRYSLAPLLPELEARVPRTFADKQRERGIDVRYEVGRNPLVLNMVGGGLHATTRVNYALEACRGRFPCVSCGFYEPRRQADIKLHTKLEWDPAWRIRSRTTPLPVHYPKPCQVTWFDIDVTRRFVAPVVADQLAIAARTIDRNTPRLATIKPHAEQIWTALQTPMEIAPRTWLTIDPSDVALTPITGSGLVVTSALHLRALTRVVVGEKPRAVRKPLPPLKVAQQTPSGLRVPFDLELPYDDASRLATSEVAGRTYKVNGKPLSITSLRLLPSAGGRVIVEADIDYQGGRLRNYKGRITLEGTPRFDPATASVTIPDLEYRLDSNRRGLFLRAVERAAHDSIRQRLRENAHFALGARINQMRADIASALTRKLATGVTMRGRVDAIQPLAATPLPAVLVVRVVATGSVEVTIAP